MAMLLSPLRVVYETGIRVKRQAYGGRGNSLSTGRVGRSSGEVSPAPAAPLLHSPLHTAARGEPWNCPYLVLICSERLKISRDPSRFGTRHSAPVWHSGRSVIWTQVLCQRRVLAPHSSHSAL